MCVVCDRQPAVVSCRGLGRQALAPAQLCGRLVPRTRSLLVPQAGVVPDATAVVRSDSVLALLQARCCLMLT